MTTIDKALALTQAPGDLYPSISIASYSRESAIDALVASDIARWGAGEAAASREMHANDTVGRALNTLSNRYPHDIALRVAADKALTDADDRELRKGG